MTEEQTILGVTTGAEEAVRKIGLYRERVFRLALSIVADRDLAEDVAQETLARAYRDRKQLKNVQSVEAWLRSICVRQALNALRQRTTRPLGKEAATEDDDTTLIAVRQVLARLKPEHAAVLALAHFEGLSYKEIGEALAIPEGTVGSRLNAAREAFRAKWEDEE